MMAGTPSADDNRKKCDPPMRTAPRVIIYTNMITPYTLARFNYLNQAIDGRLLVLYQSASETNRKWQPPVHRIQYDYKILNSRKIALKGPDTAYFACSDALLTHLSKERFDLLLCTGWNSLSSFLALRYCKKNRKPFVLWSGSTANEPSIIRTIFWPYIRHIVKSADHHVVYGTRAKEFISGMGVHPAKITVGWNCVDNRHFAAGRDDPVVQRFGKEHGLRDKKVILFNGQLIQRKGIYALLNAYTRLKDADDKWALLWIGYGKEKMKLMEKIRAAGLRDVFFTGFVDYDAMPAYYRLGDVFVLPSIAEPWGLVVNEAMASGLPVVVSKRCGCAVDLVRPGCNGEILETLDCGEITKKIEKAYRKREAYGMHSRQRILAFGIEAMAENVLAMMNSI
jgi:glycosyltransferase involved in cell wall biosynthesis